MVNARFSPLLKIIQLFCPEFLIQSICILITCTGNLQVSIDCQALLFFAQ